MSILKRGLKGAPVKRLQEKLGVDAEEIRNAMDLITSLNIDPARVETVPNSVSRCWFRPIAPRFDDSLGNDNRHVAYGYRLRGRRRAKRPIG